MDRAAFSAEDLRVPDKTCGERLAHFATLWQPPGAGGWASPKGRLYLIAAPTEEIFQRKLKALMAQSGGQLGVLTPMYPEDPYLELAYLLSGDETRSLLCVADQWYNVDPVMRAFDEERYITALHFGMVLSREGAEWRWRPPPGRCRVQASAGGE